MSTGAVLKRLKTETEEPYKEKRASNIDKLKKIGANKPNLLQSLLDKFEDLLG